MEALAFRDRGGGLSDGEDPDRSPYKATLPGK